MARDRFLPPCSNCDVDPAIIRGQCRTCYVYYRRTGKPRPLHLAHRLADRRLRQFTDNELLRRLYQAEKGRTG